MKIDNGKMYDAIFDNANTATNSNMKKDIAAAYPKFGTYLKHKLDVLLFVLEELSDTSLYELFQDSMLVEDIEMARV